MIHKPVKAPRPRKLLLLSVSAGAGHMRAAEALRAYAAAEFPDTEAIHLDAMDYVPAGFRAVYTDFYLHLVNRHPALWGYVYQKSDKALSNSPTQKLRRAIERISTRPLRAAIQAAAPDAIICTHFLPAELLAREIGSQRVVCPVWVQVTDFDLHSMWLQPLMRGYFAATEEIAYRMRARGLAADAVHVTGIPIMPGFGKTLERRQCAQHFGLDPERKIILMMSGGAGIGDLDKTVQRLLELADDFQLVALAGKNAALLASLQQLAAAHPGHLFPFGFTNQVEQLMACADLAITKPGGLTTSECLAMGVPMIIHSPIPGQEERNADYLLEQGAALKAIDLTALAFRVQLLLQQPDLLLRLRQRSLALGRPYAGRAVLKTVLNKLDSQFYSPST
ncbi:Monogalactosyldiacylglycerol synthase [Collimonas sp. OK242]|uniref:MGDG synthase family glycosyltransferase n=1 Tax=Collimonas sp. OK242 TaxID=1798195 RepID=UPI0008975CEC|nr:glycosyltransferase [Collimonas sp. OK242]SDX83493.1 Monogalactosyldiacylglycerol synthase [Collimonas sp. OK242]